MYLWQASSRSLNYLLYWNFTPGNSMSSSNFLEKFSGEMLWWICFFFARIFSWSAEVIKVIWLFGQIALATLNSSTLHNFWYGLFHYINIQYSILINSNSNMTISQNILKYIKQVALIYRHTDGLTGTSMAKMKAQTCLFLYLFITCLKIVHGSVLLGKDL